MLFRFLPWMLAGTSTWKPGTPEHIHFAAELGDAVFSSCQHVWVTFALHLCFIFELDIHSNSLCCCSLKLRVVFLHHERVQFAFKVAAVGGWLGSRSAKTCGCCIGCSLCRGPRFKAHSDVFLAQMSCILAQIAMWWKFRAFDCNAGIRDHLK